MAANVCGVKERCHFCFGGDVIPRFGKLFFVLCASEISTQMNNHSTSI